MLACARTVGDIGDRVANYQPQQNLHAISALTGEMREQGTRHCEQNLDNTRSDKPAPLLGADAVANAAKRRAEPEGDKRSERLLVALLEAVRACRRGIKGARDRDRELRDVTRLEARPDVACLRLLVAHGGPEWRHGEMTLRNTRLRRASNEVSPCRYPIAPPAIHVASPTL